MATKTLIESYDLSVTNLDTTGFVVTGIDAYDEIVVDLLNLTAGVAADPVFRLSTDGGSTFLSGASDYQHTSRTTTSITHPRGTTSWISTSSGTSVVGKVNIYNPGSADLNTFIVALSGGSTSSGWRVYNPAVSAVHNALLIATTVSSFTGGLIKVYGINYGSNRTLLLDHNFVTSNLTTSGSLIVTDLDDYDEIHTFTSGVGPTSGSTGSILSHLSSDNGATFRETAGAYYESRDSLSKKSMGATDRFSFVHYDGGGGHGFNRINFHKESGAKTVGCTLCHGATHMMFNNAFSNTASVDNAIRFRASFANITQGRMVVYGYNY